MNKIVYIDSPVLKRAYVGDAGVDLYLAEDVVLGPHETAKVPSGVAFELSEGYFVTVTNRSSTPGRGVFVPPTIVDSTYTGQVHIFLMNLTHETLRFEKGTRLAQAILSKYSSFDEGEDEPQYGHRGENATGSSGQ